jgi:hypothetical protein
MAERLPEDYRREAEKCRELAALAARPHDKMLWLRIADEWEWIAQKERPDTHREQQPE